MPLSIDGMNIGQYSYRPVGNINGGLQTNALERATPAAQRLSDLQEQLLERRRVDQQRQDQLREAREARIAQQEEEEERALQVRQERQEAARALDELQREEHLEALREQRQDVLNPLSTESLARQWMQSELAPPAATPTQVNPRLAAEAISTYRQTESPDFISRSLVA